MPDIFRISIFIMMATELVIKEVIEETKEFKTFVFEEGHNIKYEAGQFLTFIHEGITGELRRSYSIVSSPVLNEPLAVGVKRIPNGYFSRLLTERFAVGDKLITTGAGGFFKLPQDISGYNKIVLFAAGSGITPVYSIIKTVLHVHSRMHVLLVYSNRSERDTVYYEELKKLRDEFPGQFKIHFLFSSSVNLLRARLNRDLFFEFLYEEEVDLDKTLFYTCGPLPYMRMVIFLLEEFGVDINKIRKEDFVPPLPGSRVNIPPDTGSYFADIYYRNERYRFKVNYPDSILRAAKKQKIDLPYSCENGRCGNCAAVCVSGKVWLTNNEVLTEEDIKKGLTLTCTGHPVHGDVILEIK